LAGAVNLGVASTGSRIVFEARLGPALHRWWSANLPDLVVVHGDTMSAAVAHRVAHHLDIPVAHIEAGVRSGNLQDPYPEERIRVGIDATADWLFAATPHAASHLTAQRPAQVFITGNSVVSALERYASFSPLPETDPKTVLVTLHRYELRVRKDCAAFLATLVLQLGETDYQVHWPVHPAMRPLVPDVTPSNVHLHDPWGYRDTITRLRSASGVLTDSGGLVEEAATIGIPTAILRFHNDRPEAILAGVASRHDPTPEGASDALQTLPTLLRKPTIAYGLPDAADRIAALLLKAHAYV
jgi:UDP-N-acetylglucosamine 2-epimerase (non-hydrolysing)